jgi:hypothetical protein
MRPISGGGEVAPPDEVEAMIRYHPAVADGTATGVGAPEVR